MIADVALTVGTDVETIKKAKVGDITVADAIADTDRQDRREHDAAARGLAVGRAGRDRRPMCTTRCPKASARSASSSALESTGKADELARIGRMVAMHVAAANPQALDPAGLDPDVIRREKDVLAEKAKAQGKPANVIDKIVESGLKTFYKEVCLLEQAFIHEPDKNVAQAVKEAEGKVGAPIKITGYVRYALGEGIERPDTDFAAEVAATVEAELIAGRCAVRRGRSAAIGTERAHRASASWPSRSTDASS